MTEAITIRQVSVEFLRPGPSHNQLLSPHTQYLAVCNDAGAAVVTVPYEQRVFERRLKELRYETGDQSDRLDMLHEIGRDVGKILEAVPGFTGALLNDAASPNTLVHVRLTLSASELAWLPFELALVPAGSAPAALSIHARPPVSLTRHIRTVSSEGLIWPDRPRILFVSGDVDTVPFAEHREALVAAVRRFQYPRRDDGTASRDGREQFGDLLTILVNPTLVELQRECEAAAYTHVHILTHGAVTASSHPLYGVILRDEHGSTDVISGERFVSAIARVGRRPAVVTIAACDSGNVGSVVAPGASFAHAVHQSGIPLVVGSQFPLSKEGSVPLTSRLYEGLLWGEHPLHVLQQARAELHARYNTDWHDWASVVAYEALPPSLDDQLDRLRYSQAKRAVDVALDRLDEAVAPGVVFARESLGVAARESLVQLAEAVAYAVDRLPLRGQFAVEGIGLRASACKRLAQAAFALEGHTTPVDGETFADPYELLERARLDYAQAAKRLLVNETQAVQRVATLHWVLVQLVSLATVLGRPVEEGTWEAARLAAELYRDHEHPDERVWAHGSLAELWLLRLAAPGLSASQHAEFARQARTHAEALSRSCPGVDEFPVRSTRRQFARYLDWWGTDRFARGLGAHGGAGRSAWTGRDGLLDTARQVVEILTRRSTPPSGPTSRAPGGGPTDPRARMVGLATGKAGSARTRRTRAAFFTIEALPAGHGDCLWIEYGEGSKTNRVLIDCGTQATSTILLDRLMALPEGERFLELFVLSHIDSDHIGGAPAIFKAAKRGLRFGDVWFNGWRHVSGQLGARQGEMFSTAILDFKLPWNAWRQGGTIEVDAGALPRHVLPGGMQLTLLSPTRVQLAKLEPVWVRELKAYGLVPGSRVDYGRLLRGTPTTVADAKALTDIDGLADAAFGADTGAPNGTSIVLLAEYAGKSALLAADAHAPVVLASIQRLLRERGASRLKVDLFKVSHHGSQNNVSAELIRALDCAQYLISTNGDHFYHPDRQAIARILKYGGDRKTLYFNYKNRTNQVWGDRALASVRKKYQCSMVYPHSDRPGKKVSLV
jgi:beta-lactamase superfamily II metal-dependent hydrolase